MEKILSLFILLSSTALFSMDNGNQVGEPKIEEEFKKFFDSHKEFCANVNVEDTGFFDLTNKSHEKFWNKHKLANRIKDMKVWTECRDEGPPGEIDALGIFFLTGDFFEPSLKADPNYYPEACLFAAMLSPYIDPTIKQSKLDMALRYCDYKTAQEKVKEDYPASEVVEDYNDIWESDDPNRLTLEPNGEGNSGSWGCLIN